MLIDVRAYGLRRGCWMSYLDDATSALIGWEGLVLWMYLDTRAIVTVGAGRALFSVRDADALPFVSAQAGASVVKASLDEIESDFGRVSRMREGMAAAAYRSATSPLLLVADAMAMLHSKVQDLDGALNAQLEGYADAPDAAKLGLLDMAYNLGVEGLLKYSHLRAAAARGDWLEAAADCHRRGPSQSRNEWTAQQFLSCAA